MTETTDTDPHDLRHFLRQWGIWALASGVIALLFAFHQIFGPSFEPAPSIGAQIGEIAGDIRRGAWRSFLGLPKPAAEPVPLSLSAYLPLAAPVFGLIAIALSIVSASMRENWHLATYAALFGIAAIIFQLLWWIVLVVVGMVLLVTIIENIGEIFSF